MDRLEPWLLVWVLTVALNVVPAFMPPTWALLVYFRIGYDLDIWPLALVGAFGATTGRALLALISRSVGERVVPARWRANISALADTIQSCPAFSLPTLGLFALGPVPSNHLFIAAGLAKAPLRPVLTVFAVARFFSYVIWITATAMAAQSLRQVLGPNLSGGLAVAIQIVGLILLVAIMQVDWANVLRRWQVTSPSPATERRNDPTR